MNRRSDYTITKQADYGDNRWTVSSRKPRTIIASFNTREEARNAVASMIENENQASIERIARIKAMMAVA